MSHFSVMVIGEDYEELLKPFDENIEVEQYISKTKEQLIEDGKRLIARGKENYDKWKANKEEYEKKCSNPRHLKYLENEFPARLEWTNEQIYQDQIKYCEPHELSPDGGTYSTYNPQSKWDWYQLGGRWAGMLKLKQDDRHKGGRGEPSLLMKDFNYKQGWVDQARFSAIDWEGMKKAQEAKGFGDEWDNLMAGKDLYRPEYYIERYKTKENYVKKMCEFSTYAVLTADGVWHEAGKMGWWACTEQTPAESGEWEDIFYEHFLKPRKMDDLISIVDCHI